MKKTTTKTTPRFPKTGESQLPDIWKPGSRNSPVFGNWGVATPWYLETGESQLPGFWKPGSRFTGSVNLQALAAGSKATQIQKKA